LPRELCGRTAHELIQGVTHTGNDDAIKATLTSGSDGEDYSDLGINVIITYVNITPGTRYKQ
jgi:hypothetical protein